MNNKGDYVVLLHGLWRSFRSMSKVEKELAKQGYEVVNIDYPSSKRTIEYIADHFLMEALKNRCVDRSKKINFVTHSMGGIIVRYFLSKHKLENMGRVVMLSPPNRGSKQADFFSKIKVVSDVMGPALKQLTLDKNSLPNVIGPPDYDVGIIAGKYDKKVHLQYAKLDKMKDFLVVPRVHTNIMNGAAVIKAIKNFLKKGEF